MRIKELLVDKVVRNRFGIELLDDGELGTFINPYSYLFLRKNLSLFSKIDRIYVDGIVLVLLLSCVGIYTKRASFDMTSLAPKVIQDCIDAKYSIYFIGSTQKAILDFTNLIKQEWPNLNLAGFRNGYFNNFEERRKALQTIINANPAVVVVGMGTPYQEKFLADLKSSGYKGKGYTCGGFIHQTTRKVNYYPKFFDVNNLRWLYRMIDEPKLILRYLLYYPLSICLFTFDSIRHQFRR